MLPSFRLRVEDAQVWRTATWAAPFVIQLVLGVAVGITWVLGRNPSNLHGIRQYALGAVGTLALTVIVSCALFVRESARARGVAISIAGSFVVALIGAIVYGFSIIRW